MQLSTLLHTYSTGQLFVIKTSVTFYLAVSPELLVYSVKSASHQRHYLSQDSLMICFLHFFGIYCYVYVFFCVSVFCFLIYRLYIAQLMQVDMRVCVCV